jgi:hypothetical protein
MKAKSKYAINFISSTSKREMMDRGSRSYEEVQKLPRTKRGISPCILTQFLLSKQATENRNHNPKPSYKNRMISGLPSIREACKKEALSDVSAGGMP